MTVTAMDRYDVVIVGAGHGGAQVAITLRQLGFAESIALIGDEPDLPYERPPLSKDYLSGEKPFERLLIRPAGFWGERDIVLLPGRTVTAIDPVERTVAVGTEQIGYGDLVWAAGGRPRRLSCAGASLRGVHSVRSRADVDRMIAELPDVRHVVVIGGGYIGLEAAAVLTKLGKPVVLLEALDRVLARVAGEPLSRFFEAQHRAHGVDVRLSTAVDCIEGELAVSAVRLADGSRLPADLVVVGIGIVPAVEPLADAGAAIGNGVEVDGECRTSLPHVYAIGDCAAAANRYADGTRVRLESVQNAGDQAKLVARTLLGLAAEPPPVPWFWSHQYDLKLQTVGLSAGHNRAVVRGDPASGSFSVIYLRDGRVIAVDAVNAVRDYVQAKPLIERRASPDSALLENADVPLKTLA